MGEIIHLNEEEVKAELGEMVRKTVEDTLNALLDEEVRTPPKLRSQTGETEHGFR